VSQQTPPSNGSSHDLSHPIQDRLTGAFARLLATRVPRVDAVDRSAEVIYRS
jgi:hypothetical protein